MNKQIQMKRNKPSSLRYRVLYAKPGHKRRLNAATTAAADDHAGLGSDVPNIGIGKALMVILILHVLAIAAIYIHSAFLGESSDVTANQGQKSSLVEPVAAPIVPATPIKKAKPAAPKVVVAALDPALVDPASERYIVVTGDSYGLIAKARNVDERSLRALNSNRPLRAGVVLDLPATLSTRPVDPSPLAPGREKLAQKLNHEVSLAQADKSVLKSEPSGIRPSSDTDRKVGFDISNAPKALVVKTNRTEPTVNVDTGIRDSGQLYTIKSGDTLWRICNRFKVSRDAVLKLNGIEDPNKLYAGRSIKIPAQ